MCPYRDATGLCEVEPGRDCGWTAFRTCPIYGHERRRLRAVVEQCPWATRRRRFGAPDTKPQLDDTVWCHAGKEPQICYGWPEDCPIHWRRQYERLLEAVGDLKQRLAECGYCGSLFFRKRSDQRFCRQICSQLHRKWRQRRRAGKPVRGKRVTRHDRW